MSVKERLKALAALTETVCLVYKTTIFKSPHPPRTPFTREDIQEAERQKMLRYLDALEKRMTDA